LILSKSREFSSISNPGWGIYTVSIAEELVLSYLKKNEITETHGIANFGEVVKLPTKIMNRLLKQLDFIFNLAKQDTSNINKKAFRQIYYEEIPFMILKSLTSIVYSVPAPSSRIRDIAFKKAVDATKNKKSLDEIPASTLNIIAARNNLDVELYNWAKDIFLSRLTKDNLLKRKEK